MKKLFFLISILLVGCQGPKSQNTYFDYSNKDDKLSGGVKTIEIETPSGKFNVWTKRIGNNPTKKVLLLHGGPGMNHEYFQAVESFFQKNQLNFIIMINWDQNLVISQKMTHYGPQKDL